MTQTHWIGEQGDQLSYCSSSNAKLDVALTSKREHIASSLCGRRTRGSSIESLSAPSDGHFQQTLQHTQQIELCQEALCSAIQSVPNNDNHYSGEVQDGRHLVHGIDFGRINSRRSLLGNSGLVGGSDRSLTVFDEAKSWDNLDSVHSRISHMDGFLSSGGRNVKTTATAGLEGGSNAQHDSSADGSSFQNGDDSCCSFASFGGGRSTSCSNDDESESEIEAQVLALSRTFQRLQEHTEMPTPRTILLRQHSYRMQRGASFRGSLSLIKEAAATSTVTTSTVQKVVSGHDSFESLD